MSKQNFSFRFHLKNLCWTEFFFLPHLFFCRNWTYLISRFLLNVYNHIFIYILLPIKFKFICETCGQIVSQNSSAIVPGTTKRKKPKQNTLHDISIANDFRPPPCLDPWPLNLCLAARTLSCRAWDSAELQGRGLFNRLETAACLQGPPTPDLLPSSRLVVHAFVWGLRGGVFPQVHARANVFNKIIIQTLRQTNKPCMTQCQPPADS